MAKLGQYNLENMTAQEVFEASANHLIEQGEHSLDDKEGCAYNGVNGKCCAAGIFIQGYDLNMEGKSWSQLITLFNGCVKHESLILRLQEVHDLHTISEWRRALFETGRYFNLDTSFLEK